MTVKEKMFNGIELTEAEVKYLVDIWYDKKENNFSGDHFDGIVCVETYEGENRRWSRTNINIFEADGRYFQIEWEEGLTEYQENEAYRQIAKECEKVEKTIVTVSYVVKK